MADGGSSRLSLTMATGSHTHVFGKDANFQLSFYYNHVTETQAIATYSLIYVILSMHATSCTSLPTTEYSMPVSKISSSLRYVFAGKINFSHQKKKQDLFSLHAIEKVHVGELLHLLHINRFHHFFVVEQHPRLLLGGLFVRDTLADEGDVVS